MSDARTPHRTMTRRRLLGGAALAGAAVLAGTARAQSIALPLSGAPANRGFTTAFAQKGKMILQRARPPLLETPFEVFDRAIFTPNDQFFVRWHWAVIPSAVDVTTYRLAVRGHVDRALSLSLTDVLTMPRFELAAVNQCSGNSRGLFQPRVTGGQWANGAMGNARWTGVRLRDVLDVLGSRRAPSRCASTASISRWWMGPLTL
jgi:DMSO/TMAO reductase YedYZ molybdopterin-dependent catalytic subunit